MCENVENGEEVLRDDIEAGQPKEWEERKKKQLKVKNKKCVPHKKNDNDNVKKVLNVDKTHLFH